MVLIFHNFNVFFVAISIKRDILVSFNWLFLYNIIMINCDNLLTCLINIFGTRTKKRRQISNEKKNKKNQIKTLWNINCQKATSENFFCFCLFVYFAEQLMAFDQYFDLFTLWRVTRFCKYDLILCCFQEKKFCGLVNSIPQDA